MITFAVCNGVAQIAKQMTQANRMGRGAGAEFSDLRLAEIRGLGLGLAACQQGMPVAFVTAAALVNEMMEVRDEKRLLRLQRQLAKVKLLIIDELGFVPLSKTGAELLFELISQV